MPHQLESFRKELFFYFHDYLLLADFTDEGDLLLLVKPFADLEQVIENICDNLKDMVKFNDKLNLRLLLFGTNCTITISIN